MHLPRSARPWPMVSNARAAGKVAAVLPCVLGGATLLADERPAPTAADLSALFPQSEKRLRYFKQYLSRFPEADTDGDGILSPLEHQVHKSRADKQRQLAELAGRVRFLEDVEYLTVAGHTLKLDLYLPKDTGDKPPLVIWYHGGGWMAGSKDICRLIWLAGEGYAVASVQYRLAPHARVPELVEDCRAAIRWLRDHSDEYGYGTERVGVAGESAGGHLASLLGTTGDGPTRVQAVLNIYGPGDMGAWLKGYNQPLITMTLFGGTLESNRSRIEQVSPIRHVSPDDPPLLIIHGDKDEGVPIDLSHQLKAAYDEAGAAAELHVIEGAAHGGPQFTDAERRRLIRAFFDRHLKL
jgi:acetyl esterase/lipase